MCSVLLVRHWRPDVPLVLAANRDERVDRPTDAPLRLHSDPAVYGGRDRLAGGTWLAVEPLTGSVALVTNRHVGETVVARDASRHSRGELPVRLLTAGGHDGALEVLQGLRAADYNPVNALYVGPAGGLVASVDPVDAGGSARWFRLAAGVHALTVQDLDDPTSAKTMRLLDRARHAAAEAADALDLRDRLATLLASHETDAAGRDAGLPQTAACIHGDEYGTVSSSTVVVDAAGLDLRYAPGRPCVTAYESVDLTA